MAMKKRSANRDRARRGRERRTSERAAARLSMRVEAGATGAAKIVTESQNISSSGIYCHASHYLAPLSKVQLTIVLPRTPGAESVAQELVKCDGIVVRCDQRVGERSETPYELACMFTALESGLRRRIEEFVTWRNLQALRAALAGPAQAAKPRARTRVAASNSAPAKSPRKSASSRAQGSARAASPKRSALIPAKSTAKRSAGRARH